MGDFIKGWNTAHRLLKPNGFWVLDSKGKRIRRYGAMPFSSPLHIPNGSNSFKEGYLLSEKEYSLSQYRLI